MRARRNTIDPSILTPRAAKLWAMYQAGQIEELQQAMTPEPKPPKPKKPARQVRGQARRRLYVKLVREYNVKREQ